MGEKKMNLFCKLFGHNYRDRLPEDNWTVARVCRRCSLKESYIIGKPPIDGWAGECIKNMTRAHLEERDKLLRVARHYIQPHLYKQFEDEVLGFKTVTLEELLKEGDKHD